MKTEVDRKRLEYAISYPPYTVMGYCADRAKEMGYVSKEDPSEEDLLLLHSYWEIAKAEISEYKASKEVKK